MKTYGWMGLGVVALSCSSSACVDLGELDPTRSGSVAGHELSWGTGRSAGEGKEACSGSAMEKLGVRFVRLCESDRVDGGWIATTPLSCSRGAHGTIPCPIATPIVRDGRAVSAVPGSYMLSDAETAHRVCAMRFGGRLATAAELRELRARLDAAVVMAHRSNEGAIAFDELPEWVGEGTCSHPTLPEADCKFEMKPATRLVRTLPWRTLHACELEPEASGNAPAWLGRTCSEVSDCRVARTWRGGAGRDVWRARCRPQDIEGDYPMVDREVALVRCVVPPHAFPEAG
jgi:hypothetical protein